MPRKPLVSCVMATGDRPAFVAQALRCFARQTYEHRELIVVDDGRQPVDHLITGNGRIRYVRLLPETVLGAKLNLGIEAASGEIIQKLDDDDYYAPNFLSGMVRAIEGQDRESALAAVDCFLVLIARAGHLTFSGHGWSAGNSLCFYRELWKRAPFRELPRAVDWWFLKDHGPNRVKLSDPHLVIVVRHEGNHSWTRMGQTGVTEYFMRRPPYPTPLSALVPGEDLAFYESLRAPALA